MRTRTLIPLLVLALGLAPACKKSDGDGDSDEKKSSGMAASSEDGESKPIDWPREKLTEYQGSVDGIAFKVRLPEHRLRREDKKGDGTFPGYATWNAKGNPFDAPGFTVQPVEAFPESVESLKSRMHMPEQKVTVAEALPGGGFLEVVEEASKQYLSVTVYRKNAAGKGMRYGISERRSKGIPGFEAEKAWAIEVAKSLSLP
jgi:hypothetical protein